MKPLRLGELIEVKNTDVDCSLEADSLVVGHVMLRETITPVAFTNAELVRPLSRADKNKEDIPALTVKPPTWEEFAAMLTTAAQLRSQVSKLKSRSLWQRIFNRMPEGC